MAQTRSRLGDTRREPTPIRSLRERFGSLTNGNVGAGPLIALIALAVAGGVACLLAMRPPATELVRGGATTPQVAMAPLTPEQSEAVGRVVVHVDGAVAVPGVYALEVGDPRVNDAIVAAGGLTEAADTTALNLASPLADGSKVHVPTPEERLPEDVPAADGSPPLDQGAQAPPTGGLVNVNTADLATLQTLPGVGEAIAQAIIDDRDANGPFSSPSDLTRVPGIGDKRLAKIADKVCV